MNLPEFNMPVSQDDWTKHRNGFHDKMTRCTRRSDKHHIPSNINILRLSTDFGGSKQEESWNGILKFLDGCGYDTEDTRMMDPSEVDLLFISAEPDRRGDVENLLDIIRRGFLGLVLRDEVLVSGLGAPGDSPYDPPTDSPLLAGTDFAAHGACIIHGYISTLHDPRAKLGKHVAMMLVLEEEIQNSGMTIPNIETASGKIDAFRSLLKQRRHTAGEARWVFAVFDMLRHVRNYFSHTPPLPRTIAGIEKARKEIDALAKQYGRALRAPRVPGTQNPDAALKRWNTQLTQITARWIIEYFQAYPVQAGAP